MSRIARQIVLDILIISLIVGLAVGVVATHINFAVSTFIILSIVVFGLLMLIIPIEFLILAAIIAGLVVLTDLVPTGALFYLRFLPMAFLTLRVALHMAANPREQLRLPALMLQPLAALVTIAYLSVLYSSDRVVTFQRTVSMTVTVIGLGVAIPIYLAGKPHRIVNLILLSSIIATIMVGTSLFELARVFSGDRVSGIFLNPNGLGAVAMVIFFTSLGLWFEVAPVLRPVLLACALIGVVSLLLSGSRAALLGVVIGLLSYTFVIPRSRTKSRLFTFSIIAISLIIIIGYIAWVSQTPVRTDDSGRLEIWRNMIDYGMQKPLLGFGFGAPNADYFLFLASRSTDPELYFSGHNSYLTLFVYLGLTGVTILFWGFGRVTITGPGVIRENGQWLYSSLYACFIAGLVHAIFEGWMFSFGSGISTLFWFVFSLLCIQIQWSKPASSGVILPKHAKRLGGFSGLL